GRDHVLFRPSDCDDHQLLVRFREHKSYVPLMDLRLPDMSGIAATDAIRAEFTPARIISGFGYLENDRLVPDRLFWGANIPSIAPVLTAATVWRFVGDRLTLGLRRPRSEGGEAFILSNRSKISASLTKRAAQIEVLLMDVDGTMTSGGVTLLSQTEEIALEIKTFDAHDGQGLTLAHPAGLRAG